MPERIVGRIKEVNPQYLWGKIEATDGVLYFVHQKQFKPEGTFFFQKDHYRAKPGRVRIVEGLLVTFEVKPQPTKKHDEALNVEVLPNEAA